MGCRLAAGLRAWKLCEYTNSYIGRISTVFFLSYCSKTQGRVGFLYTGCVSYVHMPYTCIVCVFNSYGKVCE